MSIFFKLANFISSLFLKKKEPVVVPTVTWPELAVFVTPPAPTPIPEPVVPIEPQKPVVLTNREKLYNMAKSCLGRDASPSDVAPDELGCAETINYVYKQTFGKPIATPGISTTQLYETMRRSSKFQKIEDPLFGDIIISPTGTGHNPQMPNGHVGIVGKYGIMSNSSSNGKFEQNYTLTSWIKRYKVTGGYPVIFFRVL